MIEETEQRHNEACSKLDAREEQIKEALDEEILNLEFDIKKIQMKIKKAKVKAKNDLKDLELERKHFDLLYSLTKDTITIASQPDKD